MPHLSIRDCLRRAPSGGALLLDTHDELGQSLARLVGTHTARRVLRSAGTDGALTFSDHELATTAGITLRAAQRIVAARELGHALAHATRARMGAAPDVLRCLPADLASLEFEVLLGVALDGQLGMKATLLLAKGGGHAAALGVRELFVPLVRIAATSVVLVHNHPSGNPVPSQEDVAFTNEVSRAARLLGITVVDHLIVARGGVTSFFETGLLLSEEELAAQAPFDLGPSLPFECESDAI